MILEALGPLTPYLAQMKKIIAYQCSFVYCYVGGGGGFTVHIVYKSVDAGEQIFETHYFKLK